MNANSNPVLQYIWLFFRSGSATDERLRGSFFTFWATKRRRMTFMRWFSKCSTWSGKSATAKTRSIGRYVLEIDYFSTLFWWNDGNMQYISIFYYKIDWNDWVNKTRRILFAFSTPINIKNNGFPCRTVCSLVSARLETTKPVFYVFSGSRPSKTMTPKRWISALYRWISTGKICFIKFRVLTICMSNSVRNNVCSKD